MQALRDFHAGWGYAAIVVNALSGLFALAAYRWVRLRGRPVWVGVVIAQGMMLVQVVLGVILVANKWKPSPPRLHMFYGFVAFITVGLLHSYRYVWRAKQKMELAYGLAGLFLMGVGIRAVLQFS